MNRSRPRRGPPRRGRSREASPTREVDGNVQEPTQQGSNAAPPPRRSSRTSRGTPTPPPTSIEAPSVDVTSGGDGGDSQAQHTQQDNNVPKASQEKGFTEKDEQDAGPGEAKETEQSDQADDEPRKSMEPKKKDASPAPASPTPQGNTNDNGESSHQEIPTVSQENDDDGQQGHKSAPTEGLPTLNETQPKPADASSQAANGPGDDHAVDENEHSGDKERSTLTHEQPVTTRAPGAGEASGLRTVSVGSRSVLEVADNGGNDHEEPAKVSASPQVSLDSLNENEDEPIVVCEKSNASKEKEVVAPSHKGHVAAALNGDEKSDEKGIVKNASGSDMKVPVGSNVSQVALEATQQGERASASRPPNVNSALNAEEQDVLSNSLADIPNDVDRSEGLGSSSQEKGDGKISSDKAAKSDTNTRETTTSTAAPGGARLSAPRLEISVSSSAVVSNAIAIDVKPTAKGSSKVRRFSGGLSKTTPARVDLAATQKSTVDTAFVNNPQKDSHVHVKDAVSLESRKHRLANDGNDAGESSSCEARPEPKRQRVDIPAAIPSSALLDSAQRQDVKRDTPPWGVASSRRASRALEVGSADVESVKIRLYDIASRVHKGKGPERRFATYWEALSKFLSSQAEQGTLNGKRSSLDGVHEVLDSFLVTKQMRKLHNLLIMGLLAQCTKDAVNENGLLDFIPEEWQERIRTQRVATDPAVQDADLSLALVRASETDPTLTLGEFNLVSELWTATGREPLISRSGGDAESSEKALISSREIAQLRRHSPCLPGALSVDPLVRGIVRDESSLKVSETAVWLLIVAVREYVQSVLKDTVANIASVDSEQSLAAIEFAPYAVRSGNMGKLKSSVEKDKDGKNDSEKKKAFTKDKKTPSKDKGAASETKPPSAGEKRRRITSLDIASALNSTRLASAGSRAGSASSLAYERCCHVALNENQLTVPLALDSVQSFVVDSIESASKKPRHEWVDPDIAPAVPLEAAVPKAKKETPRKKTSSGNSHSPSAGLGREARNLAALKSRAAAVAAETAMKSIPVKAAVRQPTATATSPAVPSTPPAKASEQSISTERNITPPHNAGVRSSPPSVSPRGRGRGTKDLAAMRARSGSTPPRKSVTSTPPPQTLGSETKPAGGGEQPTIETPVSVTKQQNGAGKELRRLQEVQAQKAESPEAEVIPTPAITEEKPSMPPAVPVGDSDTMDTTQ